MAEIATGTSPAPPATSTTSGEVIVRTERLTKRFGARTAVNALDLEVRRGDVFGLLGPNGSGKTTTLRMLLGLIWPTEGSISLFGTRIDDSVTRRAALQRIGSIIEQPSFYPYLSGRENLHGVAVFAGQSDDSALRRRIEEALFSVGLAPRANDAYKRYSLGMKQRLGVAAALLTNPDLVVLDEPTNGVDPAGIVEVRGLIRGLAERGITVLLSSHLLHEVQQVCTRVAILKEGTLLKQGAVSDLLAVGQGILLGFDQAERYMEAVRALQEAAEAGATWMHGAQFVRPEPGAWVPPGGWLLLVDAPFERAAEVGALLAARGMFAREMRQRETSLEEYFLALTASPPAPPAPPVPPISPLPSAPPPGLEAPPEPSATVAAVSVPPDVPARVPPVNPASSDSSGGAS